MKCKQCLKEIPEGAVVCPFCAEKVNLHGGNNNKSPKKKSGCLIAILIISGLLIFWFIASIVIAIVATNSDDSGMTKTVAVTQQQQQAKEKKAIKIGDTFKSNAFEITVKGKETRKRVYDDSGYVYNEADGVFLIIRLHYKNIADSAKSLDSGDFRLIADGKEYNPSMISLIGSNDIFYDQLNPGIEKDGCIYFDIPKEIAGSKLILKLSPSFTSDVFKGEIELY